MRETPYSTRNYRDLNGSSKCWRRPAEFLPRPEWRLSFLFLKMPSRSAVRETGSSLSNEDGHSYGYSRFQFDDGDVIRGFDKLLADLRNLDPWMQMVFFTSPNERLGGKTPIELLRKGAENEVKSAPSGYSEQGAA
jgi:hypothetical protein